MSTAEWAAVVFGGLAGWFAVSWIIKKIQELNARPSPFDADRKDKLP